LKPSVQPNRKHPLAVAKEEPRFWGAAALVRPGVQPVLLDEFNRQLAH
jgi:hypothetical protein